MAKTLDLFCEDCVMDTGDREPMCGRQQLQDVYAQVLETKTVFFHPFVHNHIIDLEGDRATGVCYLDLRSNKDGESLIGSGYYDDVYARENGIWKFKSRKLNMDYLVPVQTGWV